MEANAVTRNGKIEPGEREFMHDLLPVELESFDKVNGNGSTAECSSGD